MRRLICLLILILGCAWLAAQGQSKLDIYSPEIITNLASPTADLSALATAKYQEGDFESAARLYLEHLSRKPGDASALYNLACCYGLLGRETHAAGILQLAYKAGFTDLGHIANDNDFAPVREGKEFSAAMDSLRAWSATKAQAAGKQGFYEINTYLPYRIYYPANYTPEMTCTLLVGLHGYGDNATAFGNISRVIQDRPVIYLVPEAPYLLDMGTAYGFSWTPSMDFADPMQESSFIGLNDAVVKLTRQIQQSHSIDKTVLFGFSQGCFMAYNIGLANPDVFTALLPFGGWLMPEIIGENKIVNAKHQKVYIGHGTQDNIVSYSSGEEALKYLKDSGFDVQLGSFEGAHRIDRNTFLKGLDWVMGM